jgi:hypothetical protein
VEAMAGDNNCLFRMFRQFVALHVIHNNVQLWSNTRVKYTWEENRVCGGNVEIIAISDISKVLVSFFFLPAGHITLPPTVILGQVMTERNVFLLFSGELDNGQCDALLRVEEKERLYTSDEVRFCAGHFC